MLHTFSHVFLVEELKFFVRVEQVIIHQVLYIDFFQLLGLGWNANALRSLLLGSTLILSTLSTTFLVKEENIRRVGLDGMRHHTYSK